MNYYFITMTATYVVNIWGEKFPCLTAEEVKIILEKVICESYARGERRVTGSNVTFYDDRHGDILAYVTVNNKESMTALLNLIGEEFDTDMKTVEWTILPPYE